MEFPRVIFITEEFDDSVKWDDWVDNYIRCMYGILKEKVPADFADPIKTANYYFREPGTKLLAGPFKLSDIPYNTHMRQPGDMRRVAFVNDNESPYKPGGMLEYLHFDYSPSGEYEVPPEHILDAGKEVSPENILRYRDFYTKGSGWTALLDARFKTKHGVIRLHDLRHHGWRERDNLWGISRGEGADREVYTVSEKWVSGEGGDCGIPMYSVGSYPDWGWKFLLIMRRIIEWQKSGCDSADI